MISQKEVNYYNEACDAFRSIGQKDQYSIDEVTRNFPELTLSSACDWAIYGFTVQGWLNLENQIGEVSTYTQSLRARIQLLEGMLRDQYTASLRQKEALEAINRDD